LQQELVRLHVVAPCRTGELWALAPARARASGEPALTFTLRDVSSEMCTAATVPSIVLLGSGNRVLVGHDLHLPAGPPQVLYPQTEDSVTAGFQDCENRPPARRARLRFGRRRVWTVSLPRRRP